MNNQEIINMFPGTRLAAIASSMIAVQNTIARLSDSPDVQPLNATQQTYLASAGVHLEQTILKQLNEGQDGNNLQ